MEKSILQCLENTTKRFPNKLAFEDINRGATYKEFTENCRKVGTGLAKLNEINKPIAIFMDKSVACLETMMGILYSGNFYTVLDNKSPEERIHHIFNTLSPIAIVTDKKNEKKARTLEFNGSIFVYEDLICENENTELLKEISNEIIDTDPMYILFTSGSTGVPKGTVISHKAVLAYATWVKDTFEITEETKFGNQTPFYFSMSITDVFSTILTGATLYVIPKMYFSFPVKLLEYLKEKEINTIYWVPSALCIVANLGALAEADLPDLRKVMFAGEVMPMKQLNMWRKKFPDVMFANLYGPTETTDICTYYIVDREFENTETLPIGKHCNNCDVMIIKDDGTRAGKGEEGELCARGSFLAMGYYNNPEKTNSVFVQNPLNKAYPEIIYKTGDIVKENERGEIIYISRKDFQIKHMGYRIELGEIETAINAIEGIIACACVYDEKNSKIVLFYQGNKLEEKDLLEQAKAKLPNYMCPNEIHCIDRMPYNANGKIDRKMEELIELLNGIKPEVDFENNEHLIDDEELDSFDIVTIVAAINDQFDVEIKPGDIIPENFNSAEAMYELIQRLEEE